MRISDWSSDVCSSDLSGAHHFGVAGVVEGEIRAAVGQFEDFGDALLSRQALGVEEIGHSELSAPFLAVRVDVDAEDLACAGELCALDHVDADSAAAAADHFVHNVYLDVVTDRSHPINADS